VEDRRCDALRGGVQAEPRVDPPEQKEREERAAAETATLQTAYHAATAQEALQRYRDEYDATTAALEKSAASMAPPKFIDNPPLTLDDQLDFKPHVGGRVTLVESTFDSMTAPPPESRCA